jgi:hypothetical protein
MSTALVPSAEVVSGVIADLIQLDPREAFDETDYSEPLEREVECWYCGSATRSPFRSGARVYCCKACARDYAE